MGAKYVAPAAGLNALGFAYVSGGANAQLLFSQGGIDNTSPSPGVMVNLKTTGAIDAIAAGLNPRGVSLSVTDSTGALSGKLNMTDALPNGVVIARNPVAFVGQIVRIVGNTPELRGFGYFTLPQMPDFNISPTPAAGSTPIWTGNVKLKPVQ